MDNNRLVVEIIVAAIAVGLDVIRDPYSGSFLDEPPNLIFIGGTGTGKTHLAIALAMQCIRLGN
jgi:AAA+ superfamily predicted ATPase